MTVFHALLPQIVGYIPEVVCDDSEAEVAEKLMNLYRSNGDDSLVVPCLDALTQLALPRAVQEVRLGFACVEVHCRRNGVGGLELCSNMKDVEHPGYSFEKRDTFWVVPIV